MTSTIVESNSPMLQTAQSIEAWLVAELAHRLNIDPSQIDAQVPFDTYNLESTQALVLLNKLETHLGLSLSPTILWNYPTIESLAHYLAKDEDSTP